MTLTATSGSWDDSSDARRSPTSTSSARRLRPDCTPVGAASGSPTYLLQPTRRRVRDGGRRHGLGERCVDLGDERRDRARPAAEQRQRDDHACRRCSRTSRSSRRPTAAGTGLPDSPTPTSGSAATSGRRARRSRVRRTRRTRPSVADVGNTLRVTVSASKGGSAVTPSDGRLVADRRDRPVPDDGTDARRRARRHQAADGDRRRLERRDGPDRDLPVLALRRERQQLQRRSCRTRSSNVYTLGARRHRLDHPGHRVRQEEQLGVDRERGLVVHVDHHARSRPRRRPRRPARRRTGSS